MKDRTVELDSINKIVNKSAYVTPAGAPQADGHQIVLKKVDLFPIESPENGH